jgi:uncharacterized protein YqeY
MSIFKKVNDEVIATAKAKNSARLLVLRTLVSDMQGVAIKACRKDVTDEDAMTALVKGVKQREDSISQFTAAGRQDLIDNETYQLSVLKEFLPEQFSEEKVREIVEETVARLAGEGERNKKLMGPVMKELNPLLKGKADMKLVNQILAALL